VVWHRRERIESFIPVLPLALTLSFLKQLVKRRRLSRVRLKETLNFIKKALGYGSQHESSVLLAPTSGSAFLQSELLAQFGRNDYLPL
jgi:hypothetical protein